MDRRARHRCPSASDFARKCRAGEVDTTRMRAATDRRANCGVAEFHKIMEDIVEVEMFPQAWVQQIDDQM